MPLSTLCYHAAGTAINYRCPCCMIAQCVIGASYSPSYKMLAIGSIIKFSDVTVTW